ncbi:MAG TPA: hypothetical protein VHD56_18700, partial [Tepidisphaeraceae bacterium]|nr:hypothetical protein [Tepidisphaeraceae bacterium]
MSQDSQSPQNPSDEPAPTPPPQRKRRIWLRIVLVLVVLLVALVALGPTIASMGFVRSIVLGKVNENLNGHVEIDNWSLGWFSPISASGIKVYDDQKALVLDVKQVKLGISLLGAIRSNFALGEDNVVDVNSFLVHLDEKGEMNLQRLSKAHPAPAGPAPKAEPVKLPDISGKFTVNFAGRIESNAAPKPVIVDPSTAVVTISDINQPINSLVKLNFRVGEDGKVSSIETSGNIGAVKQNILDVTMLAAGQKINFSDVNLAALDPFLKSLGADTQLTGTIGGGIEVKTEGLSGLSANGQIVVHGLVFGGGPLGQDKFQSQEIAIPVNITRTATAGGGSIIKFENVGLKMDQATVNVTGQVTEAALINLTQNKGPGSDGSITISADVPNIASIANQLKHTLHLIEGVELTGGAVHQQLTVAFANDRINVSQNLTADAKGTRDGKAIQLQPITFNGSASAIPNGKPVPDFRDLKIALQTAFANVNGGGETLAKTNVTGNFDLNKLVAEVSQFSDMGGLTLQGTGSFALNTAGDPTNSFAPTEIQAQANIQNLMIASSSGEKKFDVESKSFDAAASISSSSGKITFTRPATLTIAGLSVNSDKQPILSNDGLRASINGNVTVKDGVAAEFSDVSLDTDSKMVTVSKSGNGPLSFSAVKTGNTTAIRGNGALSIAANMAKLANLAQSFSGPPVAGQPKLNNGQLTGTLTLARTDQTAIDFNGQLVDLTIAANGNNVINNEQMTLTFSAKAPDDPAQPLTATGKIGSSFFTATLSDVKVAMTGAMLDMLQSATIDAQVPDAPKLYALANSLSPMPAAAPKTASSSEPQVALELTSGSASLHLNVTRDTASKSTNINLTDATVKNLAIRRGKQSYAFDKSTPITLKLSSSIKGTDKVDSLQVKELTGDVRVATLSMPEPINITDLQAKQPNLQGSIALKGKIEDVTPILAVVQGADAMPYAGQYALSEKLSTVGNATKLAGSIDVNDFKVLGENKRDAQFTEPQIAIRNDLNLDLDQKKIAITTLTLDMPKSQAVKLSMTGG